jgi:hypothetical protein
LRKSRRLTTFAIQSDFVAILEPVDPDTDKAIDEIMRDITVAKSRSYCG